MTYHTTEQVTDLIHKLTLALWDWEQRADKQETDLMNAKLSNLRAYHKEPEDRNLVALCTEASNRSSDMAMEARLSCK